MTDEERVLVEELAHVVYNLCDSLESELSYRYAFRDKYPSVMDDYKFEMRDVYRARDTAARVMKAIEREQDD